MATIETYTEKFEFKKIIREFAKTDQQKNTRSDSSKDPQMGNTTGTGPAPEEEIPKTPVTDADMPEIEKGGERGTRGELLRPSERESPPDSLFISRRESAAKPAKVDI